MTLGMLGALLGSVGEGYTGVGCADAADVVIVKYLTL